MATPKSRIVVIDVETGGLIAGFHEVLEITMLPLTEKFFPVMEDAFTVTIKPQHADRLDKYALKANGRLKDGMTYEEAVEKTMSEGIDRIESITKFGEWWKEKCYGKQMAPLAQNWAFDSGFLEYSWMNAKHDPACSFKNFIHYQARDTQRVAMFLTDRANNIEAGLKPYGSCSLTNIAQTFGISTDDAHTSMGDCIMTAAVYRKLTGIE